MQVHLTGLVDTVESFPVVTARLWHCQGYVCQECRGTPVIVTGDDRSPTGGNYHTVGPGPSVAATIPQTTSSAGRGAYPPVPSLQQTDPSARDSGHQALWKPPLPGVATKLPALVSSGTTTAALGALTGVKLPRPQPSRRTSAPAPGLQTDAGAPAKYSRGDGSTAGKAQGAAVKNSPLEETATGVGSVPQGKTFPKSHKHQDLPKVGEPYDLAALVPAANGSSYGVVFREYFEVCSGPLGGKSVHTVEMGVEFSKVSWACTRH
jgi:hypothetical protein